MKYKIINYLEENLDQEGERIEVNDIDKQRENSENDQNKAFDDVNENENQENNNEIKSNEINENDGKFYINSLNILKMKKIKNISI